jgi:hypothetical protein
MQQPGKHLTWIYCNGERIAGWIIDQFQITPDCQGRHFAITDMLAFRDVGMSFAVFLCSFVLGGISRVNIS